MGGGEGEGNGLIWVKRGEASKTWCTRGRVREWSGGGGPKEVVVHHLLNIIQDTKKKEPEKK